MADTFTANYNLVRPEPNGSRNTWGSKTNDNWPIIDAALKANALAIAEKADKNHNHDDVYLKSIPVMDKSEMKGDLPVGSTLLVISENVVITRNQAIVVYYASGNSGYHVANQGNGALAGSWRSRGTVNDSQGLRYLLVQRVS